MTGRVTPRWDAVVEIRLEAADGRAQAVQAAVDTGFTGFLSLPPALMASLGLPMVGLKTVALADGSETSLFVFNALVEWDGQRLVVPAYEAGGSPLIGMRLLRDSHLSVDVVEGGRVEIGPLHMGSGR